MVRQPVQLGGLLEGHAKGTCSDIHIHIRDKALPGKSVTEIVYVLRIDVGHLNLVVHYVVQFLEDVEKPLQPSWDGGTNHHPAHPAHPCDNTSC